MHVSFNASGWTHSWRVGLHDDAPAAEGNGVAVLQWRGRVSWQPLVVDECAVLSAAIPQGQTAIVIKSQVRMPAAAQCHHVLRHAGEADGLRAEAPDAEATLPWIGAAKQC